MKWELLLYSFAEKIKNNSKYLINKKVKQLVLFLIEELELSIRLFYKLILYLIPIIILIYDLKYNNYNIFYTYYILFFLFIYKQIYNLMYFSWYHNTNNDTILAFHYYKKFNILLEKTKYATSLKTLYLVYANVLANNRTLVYLNTGLNYDQARASLDDKEWPKYPFYYKKIKAL